MAKTFDCRAVTGYQECEYTIVAGDGDEDFIIDTTLYHAKRHHPELVKDAVTAKKRIQNQIQDLLRQSHYQDYEQTTK